MQTSTLTVKKISTGLIAVLFLQFVLVLQSCKKERAEALTDDGNATEKKPNNPPPPPPQFYFTDCNNPTYSASFTVGVAANKTITKNYVNSPGGSYAAFTSTTVNGVTISAPAGTFNAGTGSVAFTATGTPVNTGFFNVWIGVGNIQQCMMFFTVVNAPVSGPTVDPGPAIGSTGVVNFMYKGQSVSYKTVRAGDGRIWLQQNLGSPQVAFHVNDQASYGDYFQWGRWDDGHQSPNSPIITGGPSLLNPSHTAAGNPNFIGGWWGTGGLATDTWSGSSATTTNGKDPCVVLGAGWHIPSVADWNNVKSYEDLEGAMTAFASRLKLPAAGSRFYQNGESYYWSSTATGIYSTELFISDNTYAATLQASARGQGNSCRCVK